MDRAHPQAEGLAQTSRWLSPQGDTTGLLQHTHPPRKRGGRIQPKNRRLKTCVSSLLEHTRAYHRQSVKVRPILPRHAPPTTVRLLAQGLPHKRDTMAIHPSSAPTGTSPSPCASAHRPPPLSPAEKSRSSASRRPGR